MELELEKDSIEISILHIFQSESKRQEKGSVRCSCAGRESDLRNAVHVKIERRANARLFALFQSIFPVVLSSLGGRERMQIEGSSGRLSELVQYQDGSIVSKTIIDKKTGTSTPHRSTLWCTFWMVSARSRYLVNLIISRQETSSSCQRTNHTR